MASTPPLGTWHSAPEVLVLEASRGRRSTGMPASEAWDAELKGLRSMGSALHSGAQATATAQAGSLLGCSAPT